MRKEAVIGLCVILGACLAVGQASADNDWIIEIDNTEATFAGPWLTWGSGDNDNVGNYYGVNYRYVKCTGAGAAPATATFTVPVGRELDNSGRYSVFARWAQHVNRSTLVKYRVYAQAVGGLALFIVNRNQEVDGGEWVYLGNATFIEGQRPRVEISNECPSEANGAIVVADAVRFVKESIAANDTLDEPGINWGLNGNLPIPNLVTCFTAAQPNNWTVLRQVTLNAPAVGYIHVTASGVADLDTANRYVRVCISDSNVGGLSSCQSLAPIMESEPDTLTEGQAGQKRFALSWVYQVGAGLRTYYLKACREETIAGIGATGTISWDPFVGTYYRTRY